MTSRANSLKSLLSLLPACHYYTLELIIAHFASVIQETDPDRIIDLATIWGGILLRADIETTTTIHDTHAIQFFLDVIMNFDLIFKVDESLMNDSIFNSFQSNLSPPIRINLPLLTPLPAFSSLELKKETVYNGEMNELNEVIPSNHKDSNANSVNVFDYGETSSKINLDDPWSMSGGNV